MSSGYSGNLGQSMKISLAALVVGAAAALSASTAFGHRAAADCTGSQLAGTFTAVRGSAGAGSISYRLRMKNTSATPCTVTGLPLGQLLGKRKQKLATHVHAAHPQQLTAILVTLLPGESAVATARFSPDVPGVGEPTLKGQCEPAAYWFRVRPAGGGTTDAKISPATPVCEHGTLSFSAYGRP